MAKGSTPTKAKSAKGPSKGSEKPRAAAGSKKAPAAKKPEPKKPDAKKADAKKVEAKKPAAKKAPPAGSKKPAAPAKPSAKPATKAAAPVKESAAAGKKPEPAKGKAPAAKQAPSKPGAKAAGSAKPAPAPKSGKRPAKGAKAPTPPPPQKTLAEVAASVNKWRERAGLPPVAPPGLSKESLANKAPRLTKSPLSKPELREYRELLLRKRAEIAGDVSSLESEALTGGSGSLSHLPQHMADQGSDVADQDLALNVAGKRRGLLSEIDAALARIESGAYGICEVTGQPIGKARLDAKPWARLSIEAARRLELGAYQRP